jgi:hypothetical protein
MTPDQYQLAAWRFARPSVREGDKAQDHARYGLLAEIGELAAIYQKSVRDGVPVDRDRVRAELGDVLWYVAACATLSDLKMSDLGMHAPQPGLSMLQLVQAATWHSLTTLPGLVAEIAGRHGLGLAEVMEANVDKLARRAATGTIGGSGEDRAAAVASERAAVVRYLQHLPEVCAACCDAALSDAIDSIDAGAHREQS